MKYKIIFIIFVILIFPLYVFSNILDDLTNDYTVTIDLNKKKDTTTDKKDEIDDKNNNDNTDDNKLIIGNKWYSRQNVLIMHTCEMGLSGTKDFINESFLFKYRFKSKTRHAFAIRLFHQGFAPGVFSGNFNYFNFAVYGGFEYLYKIFSATEGLFVWTEAGGTNKGFAINLGLGLGDRNKNGVEMYVSYLHNLAVISRLDFYFLIANILSLRGKLGIDCKFIDGMTAIDLFTYFSGFYIGVFVKQIFKLELGGGFTINQYGFFNGFGGITLAFNIY